MKPAIVYSDGAHKDGHAAYAFVVLEDDKVLYEEAGEADQRAARAIWNIIGELEAVRKAIEWAITNKRAIEIHHDLQGIAGWANTWKTNNEWTHDYALFVKKNADYIDSFVWVKGHSGDKWNTYVDKLAYKELVRILDESKHNSIA